VVDARAGELSWWQVCGGALVSSSVLLAVTFAAACRKGRPWLEKLRLGPSAATPFGMAPAAFGVVSLSIVCAAAIELLDLRSGNVLDRMAAALERPTPARLAFSMVSIAVIPAIAEEAFFRGLLQTHISARWGRWPAIATSSLAFGAIHFDFVQGSVAAVVGLFLGWTADRLSSVRPAMAAHAVNNAAFVVLASRGHADLEWSRPANALLLGLGSLCTLAAIAVLRSGAALRKGVTARAKTRAGAQ
jgi:membrane protease YdiL (CAAX protease family)